MLKKIMLSAAAILLLAVVSCDKDDCVSCIAEDSDGNLVAHEVRCEYSSDRAEDFEETFTDKHEALGDVVNCSEFRAN